MAALALLEDLALELNIFVRTQILRFRPTQCFREGFTQRFINEAPGGPTALI